MGVAGAMEAFGGESLGGKGNRTSPTTGRFPSSISTCSPRGVSSSSKDETRGASLHTSSTGCMVETNGTRKTSLLPYPFVLVSTLCGFGSFALVGPFASSRACSWTENEMGPRMVELLSPLIVGGPRCPKIPTDGGPTRG